MWHAPLGSSSCWLLSPVGFRPGAASGKVNINTASEEELARLPRVGSTVAQRIVEFRKKNGKFERAEDLMLVSGIGDRTFDLIAPYVSVEGETTLTEKVPSKGES